MGTSTSNTPRRSHLGNKRIVVASVAIGLVVVLAAVYLVIVLFRGNASNAAGATPTGNLMFVDMTGGRDAVERTSLADPSAPRSPTGLTCQRVYAGQGTTVCLHIAGPGPTFATTITTANGTSRSVALPGVPSRARVSASGRIVTWTSFVTGDSYSIPGGFSTRTGYYDVKTGTLVESVEHFSAQIGGKPMTARDVNYWGLTVAADDDTIYATLASGGRTWLVTGKLSTAQVHDVRPDAECPSLSPDGTRVAYKKRIGRLGPWDLAVLDITSGKELRLPGTVGIDDQAVWLNNGTLAYGVPAKGDAGPSVMEVAADGSASSRVLITDASSPVPLAG